MLSSPAVYRESLFKFLEYIKLYETVYKHFELIKTVDSV